MLPHETAEFLDLRGDEAFELDDFGYGKERGEGAATEAVELVGHGALRGAGDAEHSRYPPVFVELESLAVEVVVIVWIVDVKLMRTDPDDGAYGVTQPEGYLLRIDFRECVPYLACIAAISHVYLPLLK